MRAPETTDTSYTGTGLQPGAWYQFQVRVKGDADPGM